MTSQAPGTTPVIRLSGVCKRFGTTAVLKDLGFHIEPGATTGLVGVNGAGKTTLIKCLLDFCGLDQGSIDIFGIPHFDAGSRKRLSYLPERFTPPHYLSGREFLGFIQSISGGPVRREATEDAARQFDLRSEDLDKPVRSLSKGMTQKLGLAACVLSARDLMILDEPMSGLDPQARAHVKAVFRALKEKGKTLVFTSHSLADIEEICDHMLVLHHGHIAFSGAPVELCRNFGETNLEQAFLRCIGSDG